MISEEKCRAVWEALVEHAKRHAAWVGDQLAAVQRRTWNPPSVQEGQVHALLIYLGLDPYDVRRVAHARRLVAELLAPSADGAALLQNMDRDQISKLAKSLRWVDKGEPFCQINKSSTPDAIRLVQANMPILEGTKAWQWMLALGYPVAVPDSSRQRLLARLGWLDESANGATFARPQRAFEVMEKVAPMVGASLREVDLVFALFAGAFGEPGAAAARCLPVPQCDLCPIRSHCSYGSSRESGAVQPGDGSQRLEARARRESMGGLSDGELLALFVGQHDDPGVAVPKCSQLLERCGSIGNLAALSVRELMENQGFSEGEALAIGAAFELSRRAHREVWSGRVPVQDPETVHEYIKPRFFGLRHEELHCLLLDSGLRIIQEVLLSKGGVNQAAVTPREIFRPAVREAAHSIILVHNHPTGDLTPSKHDMDLTSRAIQMGKLLGIELSDHLIIGHNGYFSFQEANLMDVYAGGDGPT